jgi:hypothetical protein
MFDERRYTKEGVEKTIAEIEWEETKKQVETTYEKLQQEKTEQAFKRHAAALRKWAPMQVERWRQDKS